MTVPATYLNFDLLITRSGEKYRAFVVDAPGGDADAAFALPFTANELDFLGNLAGARRGGGGGKSGSLPDLKELGGLLYGAVFQGKVAAVLAASLEKVEQEQIGLRLRLRFIAETSELATLPWEILYDPVQERFLALSESSPILRYLSLPKARPTLLVKPPLRVLTVLVSPPGYEELDVEREWQVLETALSALVADGKFVLDRLERPTLSALQERLLGDDIHILHFVGHGVYDETRCAGALVLADEEGEAQEVSGEELATLLHNHRSLRLVYLNACEGALSSHLSVFSGVAQTLVQQGVPAAVAMQAEITDTAAIDLSRLFYTALAAGYPVDAALTQARVAIASRSAEWAIPVLFSRSPDNRLFDVVEVLPAPDCPYPGMVPFTEKQADVFFGRDKEIADGVERLRQHPFLTVIGPSGSGKSSLIYAGVIPALRKSKRFGAGEWDVKILRPGAKPLTALAEALAASPEQLASATFSQRTLLFVDQFEELFTLAEASEAQTFLDTLNALIGKSNLYMLLTVRADFYPDLMACSLWQPIRANRLELTPLGDEELRTAILQPAAQVGVTIDEVLVERLVADAAGESGALPLVQETLVLLWEKVERRHLALQAYVEMAEGNRNGLQVAIDRRATVVYENLPDDAKPIARRIFLRLLQFGEGRLDTRRQQAVDELRASGDDSALFDETLDRLADSRLLTLSGGEGETTRQVDISHEALIAGWNKLQGWIQERRVAEQTRRRLEEKASEWMRLGSGEGGLLDEYELHEAQEWLDSVDSIELGHSKDLAGLVQASQDAINTRRAEEEAAQRRELEQERALTEEQRQHAEDQAKATKGMTKRARIAIGIGVLAIALALLAGWLAVLADKSATTANENAANEVIARQTADANKAIADANAEGEAIARQTAEVNEQLAIRNEATAVAEHVETLAQLRGRLALEASRLQNTQLDQSLLISLGIGELYSRTIEADGSLIDGLTHDLRVLTHLRNDPPERFIVQDLAFSPGGWLAAGGRQDGAIVLWDTNAQPMHPITLPTGSVNVTKVAWGHQEDLLGFGNAIGRVGLWRRGTEPADILLGERNSFLVSAAAISPDDSLLATGSCADLNTQTLICELGEIKLWDIETRLPLSPTLTGHRSWTEGLAFHPTRPLLASAGCLEIWVEGDSSCGQGEILFWDTERRVRMDGPAVGIRGDLIRAVAFSPLTTTTTLAGGTQDGRVVLWTLTVTETGVAPTAITPLSKLHTNPVQSLAYNEDGSLLVSSSCSSFGDRCTEGEIYLWDTATRELVDVLYSHADVVNGVAFHKGYLASGGRDGQVILRDLALRDTFVRRLDGHTTAVKMVAFHPSSQWLASLSGGEIRIWDVVKGVPVTAPLVGEEDYLFRTSLDIIGELDAEQLSTALLEQFKEDGYDLPPYAQVSVEEPANRWSVLDFDTGYTYTIRREGDGLNVYAGFEFLSLAFSPDGSTLVASDDQGRLWRWRMEGAVWSALEPVADVNQSRITVLAYHPTQPLLAAVVCTDWVGTCLQGEILFWDTSSYTITSRHQVHEQAPTNLAFSADGALMLSGSLDGSMAVWNMQTLTVTEMLRTETSGSVDDVGINRYGNPLLAAVNRRGEVFLWDRDTLAREQLPYALGQSRNTGQIAFSPIAPLLVGGALDGSIVLWDTEKRRPIGHPIQGHGSSPVNDVAISPDGRWLASSDESGTLLLWPLEIDVWRQWACQVANRELTLDEWRTYFGAKGEISLCPAKS